jgi:hypothetical protein
MCFAEDPPERKNHCKPKQKAKTATFVEQKSLSQR